MAARRVLPPDLMTPANASKPFMNETGPEAVPPPASSSLRRADRRQVRAGARAVLEEHALGLGQAEDRIHRVLHGVDEAGRALRVRLDADVEPDRAVERGLLVDEQVLQVVARTPADRPRWRSSCCLRAQPVIVSTTRPISCLTLRSRSGVPSVPRKYFETTMLVACCDQNFGTSTSRCSKTTSPFSLPMTAERVVPLDLVERVDALAGEDARVLEAGGLGAGRRSAVRRRGGRPCPWRRPSRSWPVPPPALRPFPACRPRSDAVPLCMHAAPRPDVEPAALASRSGRSEKIRVY